jgi:hypothetical protein
MFGLNVDESFIHGEGYDLTLNIVDLVDKDMFQYQ